MSDDISNLRRGHLAYVWTFGGEISSSDVHPGASSFIGSSLVIPCVQTFSINQVCALQPTRWAKIGLSCFGGMESSGVAHCGNFLVMILGCVEIRLLLDSWELRAWTIVLIQMYVLLLHCLPLLFDWFCSAYSTQKFFYEFKRKSSAVMNLEQI